MRQLLFYALAACDSRVIAAEGFGPTGGRIVGPTLRVRANPAMTHWVVGAGDRQRSGLGERALHRANQRLHRERLVEERRTRLEDVLPRSATSSV